MPKKNSFKGAIARRLGNKNPPPTGKKSVYEDEPGFDPLTMGNKTYVHKGKRFRGDALKGAK